MSGQTWCFGDTGSLSMCGVRADRKAVGRSARDAAFGDAVCARRARLLPGRRRGQGQAGARWRPPLHQRRLLHRQGAVADIAVFLMPVNLPSMIVTLAVHCPHNVHTWVSARDGDLTVADITLVLLGVLLWQLRAIQRSGAVRLSHFLSHRGDICISQLGLLEYSMCPRQQESEVAVACAGDMGEGLHRAAGPDGEGQRLA